MKKIISMLMAVAISLSMAVPVMANPDITVTVDGKKMEFDAQPEMVNERTMVPMRAIFEELGAVVSWDQATQTVTAETVSKTVVATIGKTSMYVDGEEKVMDVAPYVKDDRTYVPARFIAEALDCKVDWDQTTQTVIISSGVSEEYLYSYNVIKDFVLTNGIYDEEEGYWNYYEVIDDIGVYVIYDKAMVECAIEMYIEGWGILYDIVATRGGVCHVRTIVANDYGISDYLIEFKDGRSEVIYESIVSMSENGMLDMTDACANIMNEILAFIDEECEVADFGVTSVSPIY